MKFKELQEIKIISAIYLAFDTDIKNQFAANNISVKSGSCLEVPFAKMVWYSSAMKVCEWACLESFVTEVDVLSSVQDNWQDDAVSWSSGGYEVLRLHKDKVEDRPWWCHQIVIGCRAICTEFKDDFTYLTNVEASGKGSVFSMLFDYIGIQSNCH